MGFGALRFERRLLERPAQFMYHYLALRLHRHPSGGNHGQLPFERPMDFILLGRHAVWRDVNY